MRGIEEAFSISVAMKFPNKFTEQAQNGFDFME